VSLGHPKEGIRFAWRHRCSGFFDYYGPALCARPDAPKVPPECGSLEAKGCGTFASSSLIHLGVNFVPGFSTSSPLVSYIHRHKRSELHLQSLVVFQISVVAPMS
jgi:hypothetical protein